MPGRSIPLPDRKYQNTALERLETPLELVKENITHGSIAEVEDGAREEGRIPHQRRYVLGSGILETSGKHVDVGMVTRPKLRR